MEGRGGVEFRGAGPCWKWAGWGGAWNPHEAAASHAESLGARTAGGTVQHATEAVIEVVPRG